MALWGSMTWSLWPERNKAEGVARDLEEVRGRQGSTGHLLSQWQDLRMTLTPWTADPPPTQPNL